MARASDFGFYGPAGTIVMVAGTYGVLESVPVTGTGGINIAFGAGGLNVDGSAIVSGGVTLTTTGSSGAATLVGGTLNIPVYSGGSGGSGGQRSWTLGAGTPLAVGTNVTPNTSVVQTTGNFSRCDLCVGTSNPGNIPTGSSIIIDILLSSNGGSSWTSLWAGSPSNRPSIAAGSVQGGVTSFVNAAHSPGNLLRIDVIQVGSTNPGSNLMVELI